MARDHNFYLEELDERYPHVKVLSIAKRLSSEKRKMIMVNHGPHNSARENTSRQIKDILNGFIPPVRTKVMLEDYTTVVNSSRHAVTGGPYQGCGMTSADREHAHDPKSPCYLLLGPLSDCDQTEVRQLNTNCAAGSVKSKNSCYERSIRFILDTSCIQRVR